MLIIDHEIYFWTLLLVRTLLELLNQLSMITLEDTVHLICYSYSILDSRKLKCKKVNNFLKHIHKSGKIGI